MPQTSEAPEDFISSQDLRSRRSFMKGAVGHLGILLLSSQFTEELVAVQQTVFGKERSTDLTALSIGEAGDLVRRKVISPVELTRACLQRIERLNPALNAFITVTPEEALAQARATEAEVRRGRWRGPLHGIPLGLKDNIDTAGVRTTLASAVFEDRVPSAGRRSRTPTESSRRCPAWQAELA